MKDKAAIKEKEHLFLYIGEDNYAAHQQYLALRETLQPEFAQMNTMVLDQSKLNYEETMLQLFSAPFMDTHRLVYVPHFQLTKSKESLWSKEELGRFEKELPRIPNDTYLLLQADALDKRSSFYKTAKKHMRVIEEQKLNPSTLRAFVEAICDERSCRLPSSIVSYYIAQSGYLDKKNEKNLETVRMEVEKLIDYCEENGSLSKDDVDRIIVIQDATDIFAFADALTKGDLTRALSSYASLQAQSVHPMQIFALMGSNLSIAIRGSGLLSQNYTMDDIAKLLGKNPYRIKKSMEILRVCSRKDLIGLMDLFLDLEYRMKTGSLDESHIGELAIVKFCTVIRQGRARRI